jgi:hypothetical protein
MGCCGGAVGPCFGIYFGDGKQGDLSRRGLRGQKGLFWAMGRDDIWGGVRWISIFVTAQVAAPKRAAT